MTRCRECHIVDLGITRVVKDNEEYLLCPNCGEEDTVEEIDTDLWLTEVADIEADIFNDSRLSDDPDILVDNSWKDDA